MFCRAVLTEKMKRSKSNTDSIKRVKPSTSTKYTDISESDSENVEEVTVSKICNYKTYFKYETKKQ